MSVSLTNPFPNLISDVGVNVLKSKLQTSSRNYFESNSCVIYMLYLNLSKSTGCETIWTIPSMVNYKSFDNNIVLLLSTYIMVIYPTWRMKLVSVHCILGYIAVWQKIHGRIDSYKKKTNIIYDTIFCRAIIKYSWVYFTSSIQRV